MVIVENYRRNILAIAFAESSECEDSAQDAKSIAEMKRNLEFISGKIFRSATSVVRLLIWRDMKMIGDFETVTLSCGHSLNSYNGLGVCSKCWKNGCGKCLQLINDELLCPKCFTEKMEAVK